MLLSSSELLGLRWCDVNFGENGIDVSHQLSRASGKKPAELLPLKTDAAERIIDLAPALASVLLDRKLTTGHSRNEDFVFCS